MHLYVFPICVYATLMNRDYCLRHSKAQLVNMHWCVGFFFFMFPPSSCLGFQKTCRSFKATCCVRVALNNGLVWLIVLRCFSVSCISSCLIFFHTLCRLYSCLANGSPDEFQRGEQLYRVRAVKDPLQIGEKLYTLHAVILTECNTSTDPKCPWKCFALIYSPHYKLTGFIFFFFHQIKYLAL